MSKWIEKRTRPVLPLYLAALTWPVASLIGLDYSGICHIQIRFR